MRGVGVVYSGDNAILDQCIPPIVGAPFSSEIALLQAKTRSDIGRHRGEFGANCRGDPRPMK